MGEFSKEALIHELKRAPLLCGCGVASWIEPGTTGVSRAEKRDIWPRSTHVESLEAAVHWTLKRFMFRMRNLSCQDLGSGTASRLLLPEMPPLTACIASPDGLETQGSFNL